jgi:hypothetical protein
MLRGQIKKKKQEKDKKTTIKIMNIMVCVSN